MLKLFGTSCCHLCEHASEMLHKICDANSLALEEIDIADNDHLVQLYGLKIPVLQDEISGKLLCWPFNETEASQFIRQNLS